MVLCDMNKNPSNLKIFCIAIFTRKLQHYGTLYIYKPYHQQIAGRNQQLSETFHV